MTEPQRTVPHLPDEVLNEYLDGTLEAGPHALAAAHLAGCAACSARLERLQTLFAGLEQMPEASLGRDLRSGVMAAVRAQARPAPRPVAAALPLVFAAQLLLALALLAFAWPFLAGGALAVVQAGSLASLGAGLTTAWHEALIVWSALPSWPPLTVPELPVVALLPPLAAAGLLVAAGAFWVVGNTLLLRPTHRPGRRS